MKKYLTGLCVAVIAVVLLQPTAHAETDDAALRASLLETVQSLLQQVEALQARLAEMRGEMSEVRQEQRELREDIRQTLREGMSGEEVRRLQELLATDPDIYPEGLTTGFFGSLTRGALMRLQQRHRLEATGEVDEVTRDVLNQYFSERGGQVPPGLLRAPGIREAVERGVCERGNGQRPFCPAVEKDETKEEKDDEKKEEKAERDDEKEKDDEDAKDEEEKDDDVLTACGIDEFENLVGTRLTNRAPIVARWERYHGERAGVRSVRFVGPGDAMTMDYIETRLNVFYDRNRTIEKVTCG